LQKYSVFEVLGNKVIRHIKTAIRHMWRVANGLDNAAIKHTIFFQKSRKHTILAGQGGGGKCPPLPSPADAHAPNQ